MIQDCKTLKFDCYLILVILALKTKSNKMYVNQYLIFNTLTYMQPILGSDRRENLVSIFILFHETIYSVIPLKSPP